MKHNRFLFVVVLFLPFVFSSHVNAQDFGVKSSIHTHFVYGLFVQGQIDKLNWGDLPIEGKTKDCAIGGGLHAKGGIRLYFGSSGYYLYPNLLLSIGMTGRGKRDIPNLSSNLVNYRCFNSNIIPAIVFGCPIGSSDYDFYFGAGYWAEYVIKPKLYPLSSIVMENNSSERIAAIAGISLGGYGGGFNLDLILGLGKPFKSVNAVLDTYHFQLNSPLFLLSLSMMLDKFTKAEHGK